VAYSGELRADMPQYILEMDVCLRETHSRLLQISEVKLE
jgi:hypothetical protein